MRDRYNVNNSKRPCNLAVYISVYPISKSNNTPGWGYHCYIKEALDWLRKMQMDEATIYLFIELCRRLQWVDELPKPKEQLELFK